MPLFVSLNFSSKLIDLSENLLTDRAFAFEVTVEVFLALFLVGFCFCEAFFIAPFSPRFTAAVVFFLVSFVIRVLDEALFFRQLVCFFTDLRCGFSGRQQMHGGAGTPM